MQVFKLVATCALALCICSPSVQAVTKCVGPDGNITYTDGNCAKDSKSAPRLKGFEGVRRATRGC